VFAAAAQNAIEFCITDCKRQMNIFMSEYFITILRTCPPIAYSFTYSALDDLRRSAKIARAWTDLGLIDRRVSLYKNDTSTLVKMYQSSFHNDRSADNEARVSGKEKRKAAVSSVVWLVLAFL